MNKLQLQQGDVTIERIESLPKDAKKLTHLTLAEGEITGHAHRITCGTGTATLYEEKGGLYLEVREGEVVLTHEEHKPLTIAEGNYRVGRVYEYDYDNEESIRVRD